MLRQLPKMLRFIPGTAQDVRAYFLALQYWLAGSEENLASMVRLLVDRYAAGPRAAFAGSVKAAAPVEYPDVGLYHPRAAGRIVERLEHLPRLGTAGTVGLLLLRSYVLSGNARHYDGVIAALEARGLRVIPAFASGPRPAPGDRGKFFMRDGAPGDRRGGVADRVLVRWRPRLQRCAGRRRALAELDVPYITAHPLEFQTMVQWEGDSRGLLPVEATLMVAIPELDGGIWPMTFGGRCGRSRSEQRCAGCDGKTCERDMVVASRTRRDFGGPRAAAGQVAPVRAGQAQGRDGPVQLSAQRRDHGDGRVSSTCSSRSATRMLAMQAAGYTLTVPDTVDALRERLTHRQQRAVWRQCQCDRPHPG